MKIRTVIWLAMVGSTVLIAIVFTLLFYLMWSRSLTAGIDRELYIAELQMELWRYSVVLGCCVILFGTLVSFLLAKALTRPIDRLTDSIARVAAGEYLDTNLFNPKAYFTFELASLALSFEMMKSEVRTREQALRESELKFRSIAENSNSLVAISNEQGILTYASPAALALLQYTPDEMCGRHFTQFLDEASIPKARASFQNALVRGIGSRDLELRVRRKDGTMFMGELNATHFRLGEQMNSLVMIHDISERKQVEAVLRENEDRLLRISSMISDIAYSCAADEYGGYAIDWMMGAAERVSGYSVAEIMAMGCWGNLVIEEDFPIFSSQVTGLSAGEFGSCELRIRHKNGEIVWLASYTESVAPADGAQPHRLFGALLDITGRKQAEAMIQANQMELKNLLKVADRSRLVLLSLVEDQKEAEEKIRRLNVELEGRVAERTAELSLANDSLIQALRVKDEFLANMSHELRTPLTGILGLAEVLQAGIYGEQNEKTMVALHNIEESGRHLLSLINDILDLSKTEAQMLELDLQPVLVMNAVQSSLRMVRQAAQKKHINISMALDSQAEVLVADERRLKQILVNLLSNAVKFTGEGGAIGVEVAGQVESRRMDFIVWDTGIGIAPQDVNRLFLPFVQLDGSLERQYEGTGLGLTLVAKLVELHDGCIRVESQPGAGSRFIVSLPWQRAEGANTQPDPIHSQSSPFEIVPGSAEITPGAHQPLCLVAEDNEITLGMLRDFMVTCGYRVTEARNGAEAVQRAYEAPPDIVLMDIQMPVMDGLKAIRSLRHDLHFDSRPIIALTALAMPGDRERCLEAGANDYLSKPVDFDGLKQMLDRLVIRGKE
jgi:PAS domain S-box-containing protein